MMMALVVLCLLNQIWFELVFLSCFDDLGQKFNKKVFLIDEFWLSKLFNIDLAWFLMSKIIKNKSI